ncbi:MAG: YraN family protein [Clostridiales bacterium]|nr:YraN family protein [Clostridiales bacterium]
MTGNRAHHESTILGRKAEETVRAFFTRNGFREITHNYSAFRLGELDLVFSKSNTLYFIEVRLRKEGGCFGSPEDSIGSLKKKRVYATATHFVASHGYGEYDICFLAACIRYDVNKNEFRLRIIPF